MQLMKSERLTAREFKVDISSVLTAQGERGEHSAATAWPPDLE